MSGKLVMTALSDSAARALAKSAIVETAKARLVAAASKARAVLMSALFALALTPSAFASEGADAGDLATLVSSTDTISTMMGKVWTIMMGNPLLTVFTAGSLLSMGIGFFMYLKKAARH